MHVAGAARQRCEFRYTGIGSGHFFPGAALNRSDDASRRSVLCTFFLNVSDPISTCTDDEGDASADGSGADKVESEVKAESRAD